MTLLAEIQASHGFLALLMLAACAILYRSQRRARSTATAARPNAAADGARRGAAQRAVGVLTERASWETDVHELARDVTARIDSKMAALEHLLRAAHHETLRLEAAIAQANQTLGNAVPASLPGSAELKPTSHQAHRLEEETRRHGPLSSAAAQATGGTDRPYARIYALADNESGAQDIAAQVGCPVGEVELILSLRKQK